MRFDSRLGDTGLVFDRYGHLIMYPERGDCDTGVVVVQLWHDDGNPVISCGDLAKRVETYSAPLRIDPLPKSFDHLKHQYMVATPVSIQGDEVATVIRLEQEILELKKEIARLKEDAVEETTNSFNQEGHTHRQRGE